MNAREFYEVVKDMRRMQSIYFKTRDPQALKACRLLEKKIDTEIERVEAILAQEDAQITA